MSNYDRNSSFGYRARGRPLDHGRDRPGPARYMLGVYNYMTLGLGVTGLVALGTYMLAVATIDGGKLVALTPLRPDALHEPAPLGGHARAAGLRASSSAPAPSHVGGLGAQPVPRLLGGDGPVDVVDLLMCSPAYPSPAYSSSRRRPSAA